MDKLVAWNPLDLSLLANLAECFVVVVVVVVVLLLLLLLLLLHTDAQILFSCNHLAPC